MALRISVIALSMMALAGCVSTEDNGATCEGYGFKPGTDGFAACMMEMDNRAAERRAAFGAALQSAGNNYSNAMRPATPTNCTYTGNRYAVYQSCY